MDIWKIERTFEYLHFACGTFLKMSKKWTQISGYVHFLNIPGFFLSYMGSPSKMPLAISSGPSFYIGFGFLISKYSIPGPFSLRFCHYFCNKFSPSSWLARESAKLFSQQLGSNQESIYIPTLPPHSYPLNGSSWQKEVGRSEGILYGICCPCAR